MAEFSYIATNNQGKKIRGSKKAASREELADYLHGQELVVISITENLSVDFKKFLSFQIGGVPLKERVIFAKQMATMMGAGLPIIQALGILVQQAENNSLKDKLANIHSSVEAGSSLSEAFRKEKTIFSELQISLIEAGEKSGTLNEIMLKISEDLEKSKRLRSKFINAMIYPVIIFIVMIIVFVLLIIFMVPSVKDLYADFGVEELPAVTEFMISLSGVMSSPVGIISFVIILISSIIGVRYYYSTIKGRRVIDNFILKIPIFGALNGKIQLTQFSRLLSMLLQSGVPIVETLNTVANSVGNSVFSDVIRYAATEVVKGSPLSVPLSKSEVFPIILIKMLATGEETGKLDKIAGDMAEYYENEVNETTENLTKLMEPFILLIVGLMVGFIAVAIYLPLYSLGQYIQ